MRIFFLVTCLMLALKGIPMASSPQNSAASRALVGSWTGTWTSQDGVEDKLALVIRARQNEELSARLILRTQQDVFIDTQFPSVTMDGTSVDMYTENDAGGNMTLSLRLENEVLSGDYTGRTRDGNPFSGTIFARRN